MKISIIIPIYNMELYLEKCLESIIGQNFKEYEVILINDGSTDNSKNIMINWMKKYNNIIVIDKQNGGQGSARNLGIKKARGEYILFVDADDYIAKDCLNECYIFAKSKNYDVVLFDYFEKTRTGEKIIKGYNNITNNIKINYLLSLPSPVNKMFKRNIWEKNKLAFEENTIYEDLGLIPLIALYTDKIGYLDKPLYYYVIRKGSSMQQEVYSPKLKDIFNIMELLYQKLYKKYFSELEYLYIRHFLHGAGLRFLKFAEGKRDIEDISQIMKLRFPKWYKNKYLKKCSLKYKIVCILLYFKNFSMLKILKNDTN